MGSWIHDGSLDSRWDPGFTVDPSINNGFLVLCTARCGNIWHGRDHKGTAQKSAASLQGGTGVFFNRHEPSDSSGT